MKRPALNYQHGAALMVSLVMLVLLTLIGVAAMRTNILQGKMAANANDNALAFQAAESGLRDTEAFILRSNKEINPSSDGSSDIWDPNSAALDDGNARNWWKQKNNTWWSTNALSYTATIADKTFERVATPPLSVIEYGFIPDDLSTGNNGSAEGRLMYKITTKGTGGSAQSKVLLQSTYARRY